MMQPRALLAAACLAALLAVRAHGASAGLESYAGRKMIGVAAESRSLLQYTPATGVQSYQGYKPPYQGYSPPYQGYSPPYQGYSPPYQGYSPPYQGYNQQGYTQPYTAAPRYPPTRRYPPYPATPRTPYNAAGNNGPTMMGRLLERITGIKARDRPPIGDRLSNLMSGMGSVVRTVGDVMNVVGKFKD